MRNQGIQNHDNTRGNDDADHSPCCHCAHNHMLVVATFEHGWDRYESHGNGGGTACAGQGCKDEAYHHCPDGQPSVQTSHPFVEHVIGVIGYSGVLQHARHEQEQRNGQQHLRGEGRPGAHV